jgi:anti-sigma factor RsiW
MLKNGTKGNSLPDNALAKQALENIAKIEKEAQQKKMEQLEGLTSAKTAIVERINELNHQLEQLDKAMEAVTGRPAPTREKRQRKSWEGERERVGRWMEGRRGQKFAAGDLIREFPELDGQVMSIFLKPLIEAGKIKTDTTEGIRRTKYFTGE